VADAVNTEARLRLQDVVRRSQRAEKLRYPTLLLTLRTLFGINCAMLQSLFFKPMMHRAASIDEFVWNAIGAAAAAKRASDEDSIMVE